MTKATFTNRNEGIYQDVSGNVFVGVVALLLVLMLELKDKLLAHTELQEGRAIQRAMQPDSSPAVPGRRIWLRLSCFSKSHPTLAWSVT
jgi:hypothetical protein